MKDVTQFTVAFTSMPMNKNQNPSYRRALDQAVLVLDNPGHRLGRFVRTISRRSSSSDGVKKTNPL